MKLKIKVRFVCVFEVVKVLLKNLNFIVRVLKEIYK